MFKKIVFLGLSIALSSSIFAQDLMNGKDSLSYSAALIFAKNLKENDITDIDAAIFAKAVDTYLNDGELKITEDMAQQYFSNIIQEKKKLKMMKVKEEGEKFLAENAKKDGVTVTPSGLQYEVINAGEGASPGPTDQVVAHYHGMLIDGRVFDSSVDRGEPITLPVNGVIQGWQEALQMMKEGDKWRLYIPYDLAYGARQAGALIAPYSALIFDVELIEVK